ncbi:hypothetical protein KFL_006050050 [Klebsormidium nitens]|uniref:Uncharacterized protein n=1 Tax=Klebsormidium nitens TaxID=105231 RepID=A0A1Y1IHI5_KLENI|nr:hypothetical protein KFL_006050050 [Klebsormidium nitens]|eukprot:GAQ90143.1 hypothetical protein KFL_006050050 [Klebsormidium nitens]
MKLSGFSTQPPFTPPLHRSAEVTNPLSGRSRSTTVSLGGEYAQHDADAFGQARLFRTSETSGVGNWLSSFWGVSAMAPPAPAVNPATDAGFAEAKERRQEPRRERELREAQRLKVESRDRGMAQRVGFDTAYDGHAGWTGGGPYGSEGPIPVSGARQVAEAEIPPKWIEHYKKALENNPSLLNLNQRDGGGGPVYARGARLPNSKERANKLENTDMATSKGAMLDYFRRLMRVQRERRGGLKAAADRGLEPGLNERVNGSLNRSSDVGSNVPGGPPPLQEAGKYSFEENVRLAKGEACSSERGVPRGGKRRGGEGSGRSDRGRYVVGSEEHGLRNEQIPEAAWFVLRRLWEKGHEGYLAGGMVRDLLLGRTPKDIDIVSSALPNQIKRAVPGTMVFGRRFRIAQVTYGDTTVEVSSFATISRPAAFKGDTCQEGDPPGAIAKASRARILKRLKARVAPGKQHLLESALKRDITINSLLYEPFERVVYDFCGGMEDIKNRQIRTIIDAEESFQEDPARVLRAIRIAARTGFHLTGELERAVASVGRAAVLSLGKSRLLLELNVMLSYGSAERSLALLWRTGLLEILLPLQAEYLAEKNVPRTEAPERGELLLELLRQLDNITNPGAPCHGALWVALLALPLAAHQLNTPPVILLTLAKALSIPHPEQGIPLAYHEARKILRDRNGLADRSSVRLTEAERKLAERNGAGWRNGMDRDGAERDGAESSRRGRSGTESDGTKPDGESLSLEEATALTEQLAERADVIVCQMALANEDTIQRLTGLATNKDLGGVMRLDAARASALFALVARRSSPEVVRYFDMLRRSQVKNGRSEMDESRYNGPERARNLDLKEGRLSDLADAIGVIVKDALAPVPDSEPELQKLREWRKTRNEGR